MREAADRLRVTEPEHGVAGRGVQRDALAIEPAVEGGNGRGAALDRAVGDLSSAQLAEMGTAEAAAGLIEGDIDGAEEGEEGLDIGAVVADGVWRAAADVLDVVEVALEGFEGFGSGLAATGVVLNWGWLRHVVGLRAYSAGTSAELT